MKCFSTCFIKKKLTTLIFCAAGMLNITDDDWLAFAQKLKFSDQEIRIISDKDDHFEAMIQAYKGRKRGKLK